MRPMKYTEAKSMAVLVRWVRDNKHFEGWWNGEPRNPESFSLRGERAQISISAKIYVSDMIEPDAFESTGRMYRPSAKGLALLAGAA